MSEGTPLTRRGALALGAAAALPLVHVRTAGAAGRLTLGLWDHWVPAGNAAMRKLVDQWAEKTRTEVAIDFITSVGNKNLLTIAAEAQARTGHDVQTFPVWEVHNNARVLEPMDDVVERLMRKYGPINPVSEYLAKVEGHWRAMPAISGSQNKPSCGRVSFFKEQMGMDLPSEFPAAERMGAGYDQWTWDRFLEAAGKAKAANLPFGLPLGQFPDAMDWTGALFRGFGATLVDAKGNVTVKSDQVRAVLDYAKRLVPQLAGDNFSWDDASNNRALIAGKSALIFNPPSAWAVAKKDAPQIAADTWSFPNPAGPAGRFLPHLPYFWGVWSFARNKPAAKELIEWLSEREQAEQLCTATNGYDIPPFQSMTDFTIWKTEGPPTGTVHNYPLRVSHKAEASIAAFPAPPDIAVQIYNQATMPKMIGRCTQGGQSVAQTIDWAQGELEGFAR